MRKSEIRIIPQLCPPLRLKMGGHVPPGPMVAPSMAIEDCGTLNLTLLKVKLFALDLEITSFVTFI